MKWTVEACFSVFCHKSICSKGFWNIASVIQEFHITENNQIVVEAELVGSRENACKVKAVARIDGTIVA